MQRHAETRKGLPAVRAAFVVGMLHAAVSVYWGLGGTWLLDTVGEEALARRFDAIGIPAVVAVWAAVAVKMIAAVLPLVALDRLAGPAWNRIVWILAWVEGAILTIYGLVCTAVGLLVEADVIHAVQPDRRALAWHAYLWDPWFLLWGLLVVTALLQGRAVTTNGRDQPSYSRVGEH